MDPCHRHYIGEMRTDPVTDVKSLKVQTLSQVRRAGPKGTNHVIGDIGGRCKVIDTALMFGPGRASKTWVPARGWSMFSLQVE